MIVPYDRALLPGPPATSFQHTAISTDVGRAELFGVGRRQRTTNLIEHTARPGVRETLREQTTQLGIG